MTLPEEREEKLKLFAGAAKAFVDSMASDVPYNQIDHSHCWTSKSPPCGQKIEHLKCCVCEVLNPKVATQIKLAEERGRKENRKGILIAVSEVWERDMEGNARHENLFKDVWNAIEKYGASSRPNAN